MKYLTNNELLEIAGGINWTASLFSSVARAIDTVMNVGRSLGSAIRRISNGSLCSL